MRQESRDLARPPVRPGRRRAIGSLDHAEVLRTVVDNRRTTSTVDLAIGQNVAGTTLHSWDLARATGVDDRLEPELVHPTMTELEPIADRLRAPMVCVPRLDVAAPPINGPASWR